MSNATRCDRCGGFQDHDAERMAPSWIGRNSVAYDHGGDFDLCSDCAADFDRFMNGEILPGHNAPEYERPSQGMTTAGELTGPPARDGRLYLALRLQHLGVKDRLRSIHATPEDAFQAIIDHAGTEPEDYDPDWPDGDWADDVWGWNTDDGVTYIIQQYRWSGVDAPKPPEWLTEEDIGE